MIQTELLVGLARQFGHTTGSKRPLRTAVEVDDKGEVVPRAYRPDLEQHDMGAVLVSAVFDAFVTLFRRKTARYVRLGTNGTGVLPPHELPADVQAVLADEASALASQFLSICIRAIDYCPPVDVRLGEYLRALITADYSLVPDDPWGYREAWTEAFSRHRIYPPNVRTLAEDELRWQPPDRSRPAGIGAPRAVRSHAPAKGEVRYVVAKNIRNEERAARQREFALGPGREFHRGDADEARRNMFRLLHRRCLG